MTSETRYMRNDEVLGTVQSTPNDEIVLEEEIELTTWYFGIKVYIVHVVGGPTLISGANAVSIAYGSTSGLKTGDDWACPLTALLETDKVRVEVYGGNASPPTFLLQTFETEALGASSLDTATWKAYYYLRRSGTVHNYNYYFDYGSSTYDSKITNFTWTPTAVTVTIQGDGLTFVTN